jgi:transcriptional regulator with XRE-family HTH domain
MSRSVKIKHLAAKLRAIREKLGLSQSGMMRRLNIKCCYTRISEYERGKRQPTILTLLAYARAAGIHIDDLVDDSVSLFGKRNE